MEFIPAPKCASVEMIFQYQGERVENVYHIKGPAPFEQQALFDAAQVFHNWWLAKFQPGMPSGVVLDLIVVKALDEKWSPGIEYRTNLPIAGAVNGAELEPNNVTVAVKWSTGLRGRSYRGRTYHVGMSIGNTAGNSVDVNSRTNWLDAYFNLITVCNTAGHPLVVLSKFQDKLPRATAVATPILGCSMNTTIDTQRRRLPK